MNEEFLKLIRTNAKKIPKHMRDTESCRESLFFIYKAGAAAMKERCHKIAEETDIEPGTCNEYGELTRKYDSWVNGVKDACSQIAAAIRRLEI